MIDSTSLSGLGPVLFPAQQAFSVTGPSVSRLVFFAAPMIALILLAIFMRRRYRGAAACARCGYRTEGLEGFHCPECGTDLRETGILATGMHRGVPWLLAGLTWSILYSTLIGFVGGAIHDQTERMAVWKSDFISTVELGTDRSLAGPSGIKVVWDGTQDGAGVDIYESLELRYVLEDESVSAPFALDLDDESADTQETLDAWLSSTYGEEVDPRVTTELTKIIAAGPRSVSGGGVFNAVSTSSQSSSTRIFNPLADVVVPAAFIVTWLVGVVLIMVRARRRG